MVCLKFFFALETGIKMDFQGFVLVDLFNMPTILKVTKCFSCDPNNKMQKIT